MRFFHTQLFVQFQVLLFIKLPVDILHADIVDIKVMPCRHAANSIEDILRAAGARDRMHNHIGSRQKLMHPRRHFAGNLF